MASVRAFLDVSTGYLTVATREQLGDGHCPVVLYAHPEGYGWFLWVPPADELGDLDDCPADLAAVFAKARELGADYVCLDADGPDDCEGLTWYGDEDDGCPVSDADCLGDTGDCHDACQAPAVSS